MKPMHAALAGALIAGTLMFAIGTRAAQHSTDASLSAPQPPAVASSAPATHVVRTSAPARTVYEPPVQRQAASRPHRSWQKSALVIGGAAASGAGIGGIVGGRKGALIGTALGGGTASIYEATHRR